MKQVKSPPENSKSPYFPALTGLRAFAAALVFGHHFCGFWVGGPGYFSDLLRQGYIGVSVFFTLSGYLITRSYYAPLVSGELSYTHYLYRRFSRIYPLYLVALGVFYFYYWPTVRGWQQVAANLTLTQAFFETHIFAGIHLAWSLTVEVSFYLLAPALFRLLGGSPEARRRITEGAEPITLALMLAGVTAFVWLVGEAICALHAGEAFYAPGNYLIYSIFGRFTEFAFGIFVAALTMRKGMARVPKIFAESGFLLSVAFLWGCLAFLANLAQKASTAFGVVTSQGFFVLAAAGLATSLLIWSVHARSRLAQLLLGNRFIDYLGRISFATFLAQNAGPFLGQLCPAVKSLTGANTENIWIAYGILLCASAVAYELIEKPAHSLLLKILQKKKRARPNSRRRARTLAVAGKRAA